METNAHQAVSTNSLTDYLANFFDATTIEPPGVLQTEQTLHDPAILHPNDSNPIDLYAATGDISGVALYSPTETRVIAGGDIADIAFYLQNDNPNAISVVSAGGNLIPYDPVSPAREAALVTNNSIFPLPNGLSGDIQIAGPGTLEVLAGGNLNLGGQGSGGPSNATGDGIASIGGTSNPALLPFSGADIVAAAGVGLASGLGQGEFDFTSFISQFVTSAAGATYLGELGDLTGSTTALDASTFSALPVDEQDVLALDVF